MGAIYGLALACASVVLFRYLVKVKNATPPAKWTKSTVLITAIMLVLFVGVIFGVAILIKFAINATLDEFGVFELIFFCSIVGATVLAWRAAKPASLADTA